MKQIILTFLCLMTLNANATSTARFNLDFNLTNLMTDERIARVDCEVTQVLEWQNGINVFKCLINGQQLVSIKNVSATLGYSYERNKAFTKHYLSGSNGLVSKILKAIDYPDLVTDAGLLVLYYGNSKPLPTSEEILIDTEGDAILLKLRDVSYL